MLVKTLNKGSERTGRIVVFLDPFFGEESPKVQEVAVPYRNDWRFPIFRYPATALNTEAFLIESPVFETNQNALPFTTFSAAK
jgi:hypothetical protein